jgi:hypothetical protein
VTLSTDRLCDNYTKPVQLFGQCQNLIVFKQVNFLLMAKGKYLQRVNAGTSHSFTLLSNTAVLHLSPRCQGAVPSASLHVCRNTLSWGGNSRPFYPQGSSLYEELNVTAARRENWGSPAIPYSFCLSVTRILFLSLKSLAQLREKKM